jgi:hypothetical protein
MVPRKTKSIESEVKRRLIEKGAKETYKLMSKPEYLEKTSEVVK